MVLWQADGPLLDRQLDRPPAHAARARRAPASASVRPNTNAPAYAGLVRKACTAPIARRHPPHPPLPDRAPRQPLALIAQADHHLARRAQPAPAARTRGSIACRTCSSADRARSGRPRRDPNRPAGSSSSSPRSALLRSPPSRRARIRCSSASAIVPFNPNSSRSLKFPGDRSRLSRRPACPSACTDQAADTSRPIVRWPAVRPRSRRSARPGRARRRPPAP